MARTSLRPRLRTATPADASRARALDLADQLAALGPVTTRRFFGGTGLVLRGTLFGFVMKGALYLHKASVPPGAVEPPAFSYLAKGRLVTVNRYVEVPDTVCDDTDLLTDWARRAFEAALSEP
jgi:DNA transformation protein and related proteins